MVSLIEINQAKNDVKVACNALNFADDDFIESAVYQQKIAELRLNNLIKKAKTEGLTSMEKQEKLMDGIGRAGIVLAIVLGVITLFSQAGRWLGWW